MMTREEKNARHSEYMKQYRVSPKGERLRVYMREYMQERRQSKGDLLRAQERARYHLDVEASHAKLAAKRNKTRKWLADIKLASGCIDCGFKGHYAALHFDHLPQHEKKFNIGGQMAGYGKELILAEINKCEVRCANCHAIKTAERRERAQNEKLM